MTIQIQRTASLAIPERRRPAGPRTRRRLRITAAVLATVWAAAVTPVIAGWSPAWKAFGLGLLFPGGGFLYTSDVPLFLLTLAFVPYIAIFQFQFRADQVTPVAFMLASAAGAALRAHTGIWTWAEWVVPAILPAIYVTFRAGRAAAFRRARARGLQRNAYLRGVPSPRWPAAPRWRRRWTTRIWPSPAGSSTAGSRPPSASTASSGVASSSAWPRCATS